MCLEPGLKCLDCWSAVCSCRNENSKIEIYVRSNG